MEHDTSPQLISDPVDAMEQVVEWCEKFAYPDLTRKASNLYDRLVEYQIKRSDSYQSALSSLNDYFKETF